MDNRKKQLKSFNDVKIVLLPLKKTGKVYGKSVDQNSGQSKTGSGDTVFKWGKDGIWLGNKFFALAPFRVDMDGNVIAESISIAGGSMINVNISDYLALVGGTMQGILTLFQDPVDPMDAATKQYVDNHIFSGTLESIVVFNGEVITNNNEVVYNQ